MIEWTISFGNIITVFVTVCGAVGIVLAFVYRWGIDINLILGRVAHIESKLVAQDGDLKEIQKVLVLVVRNDERLNAIDQRVNAMQAVRDEWRLDVAKRLSDISQALANIYQQQGALASRFYPERP